MKVTISFIAFTLLTSFCPGQNYKEQFLELMQSEDSTKQIELLTKWEAEDANDAELWVCYFNYYFQQSAQEAIGLVTEEPDGESLQLKDSTGQVTGYFTSSVVYDPEVLQKGFEKINKGIALYPNRLDMRFGKIYALGESKDWEAFTNEIIQTVQYSQTNNNEWTWTGNQKQENGKAFMLEAIQDYQVTLFEEEDEALLQNMRTVAEEILKIYPDHIESLSNMSITYLLTGEFDKGIEVLLKAEKINPKDGVILSNIAHGYKLKEDVPNAIKYYEKMLELDDPRAVEFAKSQIEALKN